MGAERGPPECHHHGTVAVFMELARDLRASGDLDGAVDAYRQAIEIAEHRADLLVELGLLWQECNHLDAAIGCYRDALAENPEHVAALQNVGYLWCSLGEPDAAISVLTQAVELWPSPISQLLAATVLPVIYGSTVELQKWRDRFANNVRALANSGLIVDTTRSQIPTNFLLAYQGENNRDVAADLGRMLRGCDISPDQLLTTRRARAGRLRVGFLSAYFYDHTIGRLNLGIVEHLSRSRFEVAVLSSCPVPDEWTARFEQAADDFVHIPRSVYEARQIISAQQLDVLVFTDVGMDAVTTTLAYSRMAPVQCLTWGHPDTTGSRAMDYFISGALIESPDAESHYTERLARLPGLGVYYHRPRLVGTPPTRETFGLSPRSHLYVCPQTLFKFHPEFDPILAEILQKDRQAEIVILAGSVPSWLERLTKRWSETVPESAHRIRCLPAQSHERFLSLLTIADVVLDPLHFGGGNSSFEALAMNAPVVTLPSSFLRGRISAALYAKMDFGELVVKSPSHYASVAIRLATDPDYNRTIREQIREKSPILFDDLSEIRGWEQFLESVAAK